MNSYVNDFNDTMIQYYKQLKKFKPKTKEEEKELFSFGKDNEHTKREIINSNLKYVFEIAKRYKGHGVPLEDLISEGNLGLLKAYDMFDPSRDVKFFSYAVWWIRQYIQAYLKKNNEKDLFENKSEDCLNVKVKNNNVSDDEDERVTYYETLLPNNDDITKREEDKEREKLINNLLSKVDNRSRGILEKYYGLGNGKSMTLEEVGKEYGLSKERVRQISKKNIRLFRSIMLEKNYTSIYM